MKVRISARVISDFEGSQAWYETSKPDSREDVETLGLMRKVRTAKPRTDGSVTVELTDGEVAAAYERADWLMGKSRDGIADRESGALADYNAGAALARQIEKLRSESP